MPVFKRQRSRLPCPKCGFLTDAEFKFCASCGAPLPGTNAYVEPEEEAAPLPKPQRSLRAVASVILGVAAAFPLGLLTGIPAAILGFMVLKRRETGTGFAIAGIVLGLAGTLITTPAMVLPRLLRTSPEQRRARLEEVMQQVQSALDEFASAGNGSYPAPLPDADTALPSWLPADFAANPYSGQPYEYGFDFFYLADGLDSPREKEVCNALNLGCPYARIAAPESVPGTVIVLGYTDSGLQQVTAYAVVGFGSDVAEPLSDMEPISGEIRKEKVFFVLSGGADDVQDAPDPDSAAL